MDKTTNAKDSTVPSTSTGGAADGADSKHGRLLWLWIAIPLILMIIGGFLLRD